VSSGQKKTFNPVRWVQRTTHRTSSTLGVLGSSPIVTALLKSRGVSQRAFIAVASEMRNPTYSPSASFRISFMYS
jgi:hypothetical protein